MGKISELLRWKTEYEIKGPSNEALKKVWLRVIGDEDLTEAFKQARVASSKKRIALRDPQSSDFIDEVLPLEMASREDWIAIISASKSAEFQSEAYAVVERDDRPEIEEVAVIPDAPKLEEQEILDSRIDEVQKDYEQRLQEYIENKNTELQAILAALPDEELLKEAQQEVSNVIPFRIFLEELNAQKIYRACYEDKDCKVRSFDTVDEFKNTHSIIKEQLIDTYNKLEISPDTVKN